MWLFDHVVQCGNVKNKKMLYLHFQEFHSHQTWQEPYDKRSQYKISVLPFDQVLMCGHVTKKWYNSTFTTPLATKRDTVKSYDKR